MTKEACLYRLYVAGGAPNSARALSNLQKIAGRALAGDVQIEVVDVLQTPQRALSDGILVTPTLVRVSPQPVVKIIGDLSRTDAVLSALGLDGEGQRQP